MVVLGLRSGGRGEREGFSLSFTRRVDKSRGETRKVALTNCDVVLSLSLSFQLLLLPSSLALCRRLISIDVVNSASTSTAFSLSLCVLLSAPGFRLWRNFRGNKDRTTTSRSDFHFPGAIDPPPAYSHDFSLGHHGKLPW